jgi:hypothetical protein
MGYCEIEKINWETGRGQITSVSWLLNKGSQKPYTGGGNPGV